MIISGKIDLKKITQGAKEGKPWERCEFEINKMKYATFKKEIYSTVNEGDVVEVELEQNGKYWNIKSMKKVQPEASNNQIQSSGFSSLFSQEILSQLKRIADALEKK